MSDRPNVKILPRGAPPPSQSAALPLAAALTGRPSETTPSQPPKKEVPTPPRRRSLTKEQPAAPPRPTSSQSPQTVLSPQERPVSGGRPTSSGQPIPNVWQTRAEAVQPIILRPTSGQTSRPTRGEQARDDHQQREGSHVRRGGGAHRPTHPRQEQSQPRYPSPSSANLPTRPEPVSWPEGSLNQMLDRLTAFILIFAIASQM